MIDVTEQKWEELNDSKTPVIIFVHTPFCATCQLAEKMLRVLEEANIQQTIYRLNASFFPEFMETNKIKSVPALIRLENGKAADKLYAFESVTKLYGILNQWK